MDYQKKFGSLGIGVVPPIYGGISRQNALFAPKCGKITAIPREPLFLQRLLKKQRPPGELPVTLPHYEDRISESTAKTFFKHKGHEGYKGNSKTL